MQRVGWLDGMGGWNIVTVGMSGGLRAFVFYVSLQGYVPLLLN